MRLKFNKTKKGRCYYIIRSVYHNGKNTSEIYEKLGYLDEIKAKYNCADPEEWMTDHLAEVNEKENAEKNVTVLPSQKFFRQAVHQGQLVPGVVGILITLAVAFVVLHRKS